MEKEKIEQLFLEMPRIDVVYISFYVFFFYQSNRHVCC